MTVYNNSKVTKNLKSIPLDIFDYEKIQGHYLKKYQDFNNNASMFIFALSGEAE